MSWQDHITVGPTGRHGQARTGGTRTPAAVGLANVAAGSATIGLDGFAQNPGD